jgi:hypothetical protein
MVQLFRSALALESSVQKIHEKALIIAQKFKRAEADLVSILQEVDAAKVYSKMEYPSLFQYCVGALGLSESVAANFITVSRKANEVPVLQAAIQAGSLSVSKARKIVPILTLANQEEWVEKARALSTRQLEEEVAKIAPREATPERMRVVSEDRVDIRFGISMTTRKKLLLAQDLESQRRMHAASLEETLETLLEIFLEVKDPVRRAVRILERAKISKRDGALVEKDIGGC